MTALDDLPDVDSFFGFDLRTGSLIVAAICVVHPMAYGCSLFIPMSYLLVTVWILVALFFATSIVLFCGLANILKASSRNNGHLSLETIPNVVTLCDINDPLLCSIWIWYTVIFVAVMLMMMILLALVYTSRRQRSRVFVAIFGMLWYILTIYFILVVNSHRKTLVAESSTQKVELKALRKGMPVSILFLEVVVMKFI